jgi:hypothetical protein
MYPSVQRVRGKNIVVFASQDDLSARRRMARKTSLNFPGRIHCAIARQTAALTAAYLYLAAQTKALRGNIAIYRGCFRVTMSPRPPGT